MARWLIDMAGVKITVRATLGPARDVAKLALASMRHERTNSTQGIELNLTFKDGVWELLDRSNKLRRKLDQAGDVIYHLTDRIVFHLADKAKDVHCLHAAAVAYGENALVVPANSGAGKSTFTTWLTASGFEYLTDELIMLNSMGMLEGLARPIQINIHGLAVIDHLLVNPELVQKGKFATTLPVQSLDGKSASEPKKLALFIFPRYQKGADFCFEKLSSAEAGMRLMANHVNARSLDGHGFRVMMKLIRNTPCYSLEYGGFATLPSDFSSQLEALLTQPTSSHV
jgi:hypothetical protein